MVWLVVVVENKTERHSSAAKAPRRGRHNYPHSAARAFFRKRPVPEVGTALDAHCTRQHPEQSILSDTLTETHSRNNDGISVRPEQQREVNNDVHTAN